MSIVSIFNSRLFYVVLQPVSIILSNTELRMSPSCLKLGLLEKDRKSLRGNTLL